MFEFIKKMFIGLLSACTRGNFGESLVCNLKEFSKMVNLKESTISN